MSGGLRTGIARSQRHGAVSSSECSTAEMEEASKPAPCGSRRLEKTGCRLLG